MIGYATGAAKSALKRQSKLQGFSVARPVSPEPVVAAGHPRHTSPVSSMA